MVSCYGWLDFYPSADDDADVNECQDGLSLCVQDSECVNTIGSYLCNCDPGYTGNGFSLCSSTAVLLP